jgi:hypothetical protein
LVDVASNICQAVDGGAVVHCELNTNLRFAVFHMANVSAVLGVVRP